MATNQTHGEEEEDEEKEEKEEVLLCAGVDILLLRPEGESGR